MSSVKIPYKEYHVNQEWKKIVKENTNLTEEEKKVLMRDARKSVFLKNLWELIKLIIKVALCIGLAGLVYMITHPGK